MFGGNDRFEVLRELGSGGMGTVYRVRDLCLDRDAALKLMIDLNHRFALDGNDPNSYGGLLWCLGLFD